ncbi:MAG: OmpA family protein, partial [Pseudomonadota bacterium]
VSNEANVAIRLEEDLFRNTGTIIGRVVEGDCSADTFTEEQGVAGIRVYLEDGRYAVSDEGGRFHFEGLPVGTHVAQLDTFSVPDWFDVIGCQDTPGFSGRADSQFVRLNRGSLLRADFYLRRKPAPEGRIELELVNRGTDSAEQVAYDLTVNGIGNVDIEDIEVMVMLPDGVEYTAGSMRVDGQDLGDPRVSGPVLSLALPDRSGNWASDIQFVADIGSHVSGELTTKALARFDTPIEDNQQTPLAETVMVREPTVLENAGYVLGLNFAIMSAELSADDKRKLDDLIAEWRGVENVRISAVGHSDSTPIRATNRSLFGDNYLLSQARARSAASYIADALELPGDAVQVEGRGPDEPVADNLTPAGREKNRRVEMILTGERPSRPSFLEVTKASSGTQSASTRGAVPGTETARNADDGAEVLPETEPPIESLTPGTAMLLPERGFLPAVPAAKVSIQHAPDHVVAVFVNDAAVNPVNFDTTELNTAGTVAVSRWKGVELRDGPNQVRAVVSDQDGNIVDSFLRSVYYSGQPIRGEIVVDKSTLVADGKTRPVVAVRLFARSGRPSRAGMVGAFRVRDPYRAWWEVENDRRNQLVVTGDREPTYRIGADGIALLELEPTTRTGEVKIDLKFENYREQEVRAWLEPASREWILVGFAEGTAGYNTLSDNAAAAEEAGNVDGYYDDGRVAFFAKGSIRGDFLLTMAYDSDRERDEDTFNTVIDPTRYYPLYADTAEQRFEAASQRKLYVKLERNQFYALFGDFETGLTVTDLARYQRRFNGFLSEYRGENAGYTAFAAESSQSFNRDEIRGDGTSGLYQLSNAPIITNSEEIRLEVRDRFDSGVVLETTVLRRFLDYNLDTLNGTVFFKKPVPNRDLNFNPVFIIAEYESRSTNGEDLIAGGRGSLRTSDDRLEVGVTRIDDRTQGAEADLTGADLRWQINDQTLLTAEIAETNSIVGTEDTSGRAHSVELEHNGERLDVRAFMREVEDSYGLGYQAAADSGIRRLGVDARGQVGERVFIEGEAGWQQNLETRDIRNLASARVRYEVSGFTGSLGVTHASDEFDSGESRTSDLAEIGVSQRVFGGRVNLRANGSTALGADAESADYPNRVVLGADYRIMNGLDMVAEYEKADGPDLDASMSRLGVRATPWARAQVDTSVSNQMTEFGPRLFANLGLVQGFQLSENWIVDIGLDQTSTLLADDVPRFDDDRELPSGSLDDDFLAVYTGATYTAPVWSANSRIEYRDSDAEERMSLLLGWYREPTAGHGLSAGLTVFQGETSRGREMINADLRLGWAYRKANGVWSFLDRLDLIYDDMNDVETAEKSWRIINNFNANRRIGARSQLSLQYAFKYVRSNFDGADYTGYTDLIGADFRRGFGRRFDAGISTSVYHSWESDVIDFGVGVDVGFNIMTNTWILLGYNFAGFEDADFQAARYTAAGPFLRFQIKADQRTLKSIAGQR